MNGGPRTQSYRREGTRREVSRMCSVDVILKWGFPMTEACYEERQATGRTRGGVAKQPMYHLHRNTDSDIELVMELNDDEL